MKMFPVISWPWWLTLVAFAAALAMVLDLGLQGTSLLNVYWDVSIFTSVIALIVWMVVPMLRAAPYRAMPPISAGVAMIRERLAMVGVTFVAFPIFMTAFTTMKIGFPFYTGYGWDGFWTAADAAIFRTDPWRLTHMVIGRAGGWVIAMTYAVTWALSLALAVPLVCYNWPPARAARAVSALMLAWLVGGVLVAALFSTVGPVFAYLVDPALGQHFAPLKASLAASLPADGPTLRTQDYLAKTYLVPKLFKGGGISAMPSMHVAVTVWVALVAPRGIWRWLALVQFAIIWVGSVHFGYHYALDGLLGGGIALACWRLVMGRGPAAGDTGARPA